MSNEPETNMAGDSPRLAALEAALGALREEHAVLQAQFAAFLETDRIRDLIPTRTEPPRQPARTACKLSAAEFIEPGSGFYQLEQDEGGEPYRWTGPGNAARVRFNVDRGAPLLITLELALLGANTEHDVFTVEVDGIAYPMRAAGGIPTVLQAGPVPPRAGPGVTELLFHIPVAFSPGNTDARRLGVAMRSVAVGPA